MAEGADAVVIGGGFFGCEMALEMRRLGFSRVVLCEREGALLRRASYVNQARIHNGYHYPRSLATAERSRANFQRFVADYAYAVAPMEKIYAIAADSRVTAGQFAAFCAKIGAPCREAGAALCRLFEPDLIEAAFLTHELAFDADALARAAATRLAVAGVEVRVGTAARVASTAPGAAVPVETSRGAIAARAVVNCTYADTDRVGIPLRAGLKRELTEMVLIEPPRDVAGRGITVMDGPFFSTMPFPAAGLHSLSHVRYTPHEAWSDADAAPMPQAPRPARTNRAAMLRDAARYLPCLRDARPVRSLFEVKTVLARNEGDDGRPILFEACAGNPRIVSVMGSKIDNVYDARDALAAHRWEP